MLYQHFHKEAQTLGIPTKKLLQNTFNSQKHSSSLQPKYTYKHFVTIWSFVSNIYRIFY